MELSPAQKHLINGLHLFGVERDAIVGIAMMLNTPEMLDEMMEWMAEHIEAGTHQRLKTEDFFRKTAEMTKRQ